MPLNYDLLRATQKSIMDPESRFNMSCWCCCIAGHALKAAGKWKPGHPIEFPGQTLHTSVSDLACELLGIPRWVGETLFYEMTIQTFPMSREQACARIDDLILAELKNQPQPEPDFADFSQEYEPEETVEEELVLA